MVDRICLICGAHFEANLHRIKNGGAKYCGPSCYHASQRHPKMDALERFWSKVDKSGGPDACWIWHGTFSHGYGVFGISRSRYQFAHRMSWSLVHGPIPEGMFICHHCDNPQCVNPTHLFLGSPNDNTQDMIAKGRQASPEKIGHKGESNGRAKVTENDVLAIRSASALGVTQKELAARYGISDSAIEAIIWRVNWKHI